ncbi:hypothetical protein BHE74_00036234 [Ensete ventricosum]|nr:hypothetical protein BHE74_00036234 [Ensete ventricosum]
MENQDLFFLDICPVGATVLFTFFPLEVLETTIPFGLFRLAEQLQRAKLVAHFNRLRTYPFHVEEKVLMLHGVEFRSRLRMATNTPSSVYRPLHEYRILRVSNSPHLCELRTTLSVITQHLPLCTVSSITKRPALP